MLRLFSKVWLYSRSGRIAWLFAVCCLPTAVTADMRPFVDKVRQRVVGDLAFALQVEPDFNVISSLVFPLSEDYRRRPQPLVERVLERVGRKLAEWERTSLSCPQQVDLYLTQAFVQRAGIASGSSSRLPAPPACPVRTRLDLSNALILRCRFAEAAQPVDDDLQALARAQGADGSFKTRAGRSWFYLTSHALLALHWCGGERSAVDAARNWLMNQLPRFARQGWLDRLAESLVFLRWTGTPASDEARYRAYLLRWMSPDGGFCERLLPGCRPHSHTSAVMLELLNQSDGSVGSNR